MPTHPPCRARELVPFALIAFGLPFLMGVPLYFALQAGYDTSVFANTQMYYPAAGAIAALLLAPQGQAQLPRRFFFCHLLSTAVLAVCCLGAAATGGPAWTAACNVVIVVGSVLAWALLLTQKKPAREAAGLRWHGGLLAPLGCLLLFLALRTASVFLSMLPTGQLGAYLGYWASPTPYLLMLLLIPNFFLSFLPFFGEEYGWRFFLQPRLQGRFGRRGGVLLLGVLWGLWHLPLNLFFYAPDTALQSIASQLVTCICFGVFFAWAYLKTQNIWVPTLLHFFNNNMILVYSGTGDASILSGQTVAWGDVAVQAVLFGLLFLPFLAAKEFRSQR